MQDRVRRSGWQLPRPSPLSFLPGPHPPSTFAALSPTVAIEFLAASHLCLSTSTDCLRFAKNPFFIHFSINFSISYFNLYYFIVFLSPMYPWSVATHARTHSRPPPPIRIEIGYDVTQGAWLSQLQTFGPTSDSFQNQPMPSNFWR